MPGFLLHVGAVMTCAHGIPATIPPMQPRALVMGQPIMPINTVITVAGCPFQMPAAPNPIPDPCLVVQWAMPATRVLVSGQPAAVGSPGPATATVISALGPAPPAIVSYIQPRVIAT